MRHDGIVAPRRPPINIENLKRTAAQIGGRVGFPDDTRRAETPHVIDCMGLSEEHLGQRAFTDELRERRQWCVDECGGDHEIESIRDQGRLVGRRFRFGDLNDAVFFKLRFDTNL